MTPKDSPTILHVEPEQGQPFDFPLEGDKVVIGRSSSADVVINDGYLSRQHSEIYREGDRLMIRDLGSVNGTLVNGRRIDEPTALAPGDRIELLDNTLTLRSSEPAARAAPPVLDSLEGTVLLPAQELTERFRGGGRSADEKIDFERQTQRLAILNEVHRALAGSIELPELLDLILDRAFDHLTPEQGAIFLQADDAETGWKRVASRRTGADEEHFHSSTLISEVAEKGMAALVLDTKTDEQYGAAESIMSSGVRSLIAAPLLCPDGSLGMIALNSTLSVRQFDEEDLELLSSLASVAALRIWSLSLAEEAAERRRMASELELARRIQKALLPDTLPDVEGYEIEAMNVPSRGVSGDSYQVLSRGEDTECVLFLADVSGKGMAASLLTATLEALAAAPIQEGLPPDELFALLSRLLHERTPPEKYATAFLAVLDAASGTVTYANGGHNPALVTRRGGEVETLDPTGMPIGLMPEAAYSAERIELAPGDSLVLYTDGITEAANPEREEYEIERLSAVCSEHRADPLPELIAAIEADLDRFLAGEDFADDRTVVILRRQSG